ncbi:hypothetical protein JHK82_050095 [Glycine max]|nr:hypothetical protein JHK82_050095 [Glycine max]
MKYKEVPIHLKNEKRKGYIKDGHIKHKRLVREIITHSEITTYDYVAERKRGAWRRLSCLWYVDLLTFIYQNKEKYRLEVMVYHKEECTNFFLWDRECANLIGPSDDEVNRLKIADGDVDLNVYLEALDKILGYTLAFKVKVQSKFRNFVVLKYSFDSDLINTIIDLLPDIEAPYKVHFPLSDTNDPLQYETPSFHTFIMPIKPCVTE